MRLASICIIGVGVLVPLTSDAYAQGSDIRGISFAVDTTPAFGLEGPGPIKSLGLKVTWAETRGRVDVLSRPVRPFIKIGDATVGQSLAVPGDYYLFDSTGFVLVRPATKQYSIFRISDAAFNYEGRRDGWPAFFPLVPNRVDTIPADSAATQMHGEQRMYWHADITKDTVCTVGGCSIEELARGRTIIADAPLAELVVARWFGPAQALGEMPGGVSRLLDKPIRVLSWGGIHRLRDLRATSVSRSSLTVPADFVEAPWPGFPSSTLTGGVDRGAKWHAPPTSR